MRLSLRYIIPLLLLFQVQVFAQNSPGTDTDALQNYNNGRDMENRNRMFEANYFYNAAIKICNDKISGNAASADTYTILTWALRRQKQYQDAVVWGERGLRLYPDEYRIIETMGEAYFYLNDYDSSLRYMQRYANAVPQGDRTSVSYFFIGEIYRLRKQYFHADIAYSTAVSLEPSLALWWYRLGMVREAAGDYTQAVVAYEQAVKLNPNYPEANEGLARSRKQTG
ncbi:MAG: tetratricopeptide repeat protein [Treponema sp.]|nr:tetratricopeptide repeat protein [Treponema sp.]